MGKVKVEMKIRRLDEIKQIFEDLKAGKVKGRIVVKLFDA